MALEYSDVYIYLQGIETKEIITPETLLRILWL